MKNCDFDRHRKIVDMDQDFAISTRSIPHPFHVHALDEPRASAAGVELLCITFDFTMNRDEQAFAVLSDEERARAGRFVRHEDAIRFATTRVVLRHALAQCYGLSPAEVRLERDAAGRPHVIPPDGHLRTPLDFNVSHSGGHALVALAAGRRVGVDIEARRADLDWQRLAAMVFGPHDEAHVSKMPTHQRLDAFYDVWTAKEALLKALGSGVVDGLTWFSVLGGKREAPYVQLLDPRTDNPSDLTRFDAAWCTAPLGYAACVAWSRCMFIVN